MVHWSQFDVLLAEHWAKGQWEKEATHHPYQWVWDGYLQNGLWGLSLIVQRLRLMKYFLSGLIPHLTFLIFDLLMVIIHLAGFKGQILKKVLSLLIELFLRNLIQNTCCKPWWQVPDPYQEHTGVMDHSQRIICFPGLWGR